MSALLGPGAPDENDASTQATPASADPLQLSGPELEPEEMAALAGEDGAYVVVRGSRSHAAKVPLRETFHMYLDPQGTLRTDHVLRMWDRPALRLHYKLEPAA